MYKQNAGNVNINLLSISKKIFTIFILIILLFAISTNTNIVHRYIHNEFVVFHLLLNYLCMRRKYLHIFVKNGEKKFTLCKNSIIQ
jgi:hypothetical protein